MFKQSAPFLYPKRWSLDALYFTPLLKLMIQAFSILILLTCGWRSNS